MKTKKILLAFIAILVCLFYLPVNAQNVWVEAESFTQKGGWIIDPQFMDQMGSPYLMAHGKGTPVADAETTVQFAETGTYHVYVRTYNWTSPWKNAEGPGKFQVKINDAAINVTLGSTGSAWLWQDAGTVSITSTSVKVSLHDLTGFNGRCDAIFFTKGNTPPPASGADLTAFRYQQNPIVATDAGTYDLVVVGGGVAGICAAISAARLGLSVALIHNRTVWGGNNSSDVRVHLGGRVNITPYPQLGAIVSELSPSGGGNAGPAARYEDDKKKNLIEAQPTITPYLNMHAFAVEKEGTKIKSVKAKNTQTGAELIFHAPLFVDCTGDGWIGTLAGASYLTGTEGKNEFEEPKAPAAHRDMTMGSSVQWYSTNRTSAMPFPDFEYGITFNEQSVRKVTGGEWTWETGMDIDQIEEFERIRDYGMLVIYTNWSFLKNYSSVKDTYANRELDWVASVAGKRESRRLVGDFILKEQDIRNQVVYPDGTATTSWSIDLHYPVGITGFSGPPFLSTADQSSIYGYPIPYRCLYSKDVSNLFMAGRNISVTHIALGTMRVMRTTGMLGEVVGIAAAICKTHQAEPRAVYEQYLGELKSLMIQGVGINKDVVANYPKYNLGEWLGNLWDEETGIPIEDNYTLTGHEEVKEFYDLVYTKKITLKRLIIQEGASNDRVTNEDIQAISNKVAAITELVNWEGLKSVTTTNGFFDKIQCTNASIHLIDCPALVGLDGFDKDKGLNVKTISNGGNNGYKKIGGDFIVKDCPFINFYTGAGKGILNTEELNGDLIIDGVNDKVNGEVFPKLKKIGGDLEISNCIQFRYGLSGGSLEYVGGNFTLKNNRNQIDGNRVETTLDGLDNLLYTGGDMTLINNDKMPTYSEQHLSYCFAKHLKETRVIKGNLIIGIDEQKLYNLNLIESCPSGYSNFTEPDYGYVTAISTVDTQKSVRVFMNGNTLVVVNSVNLAKIEVFDLTGKSAASFSSVATGVNQLNVSRLAKGTYVVKTTAETGKIETVKVAIL